MIERTRMDEKINVCVEGEREKDRMRVKEMPVILVADKISSHNLYTKD